MWANVVVLGAGSDKPARASRLQMRIGCLKTRIWAPTRRRAAEVRETGDMNMAARCGGYAVRPMVWPMLLRWDGCGWNRNNGTPTLQRIGVEA
jgi:hypothetical protein